MDLQTDGAGVLYGLQRFRSSTVYRGIDLDTGKGGREGESLDFDFQVPAARSERDNFNTLISTGDYPIF